MNNHTRWPAMARVQQDKKIEFVGNVVRHWWRDENIGAAVAARSQWSYLRDFTVPLSYHGNGWYEAPFVAGRHPEDDNDVLSVLQELHAVERIGPRHVGSEYMERCVLRMRQNHPDDTFVEQILAWPGWDYLVGTIGSWHGDPTLTNCIITVCGKPVLIDHSPQWYGPQEYDLAKLRRCKYLKDDATLDGMPPERGDKWLGVVVANMIGSHAQGELRDKLLWLWSKIV